MYPESSFVVTTAAAIFLYPPPSKTTHAHLFTHTHFCAFESTAYVNLARPARTICDFDELAHCDDGRVHNGRVAVALLDCERVAQSEKV